MTIRFDEPCPNNPFVLHPQKRGPSGYGRTPCSACRWDLAQLNAAADATCRALCLDPAEHYELWKDVRLALVKHGTEKSRQNADNQRTAIDATRGGMTVWLAEYCFCSYEAGFELLGSPFATKKLAADCVTADKATRLSCRSQEDYEHWRVRSMGVIGAANKGDVLAEIAATAPTDQPKKGD